MFNFKPGSKILKYLNELLFLILYLEGFKDNTVKLTILRDFRALAVSVTFLWDKILKDFLTKDWS